MQFKIFTNSLKQKFEINLMIKVTILKRTIKDNFNTTISCNKFDFFGLMCSDTTLIKNGEKNENQKYNSFRSSCFWFNFI